MSTQAADLSGIALSNGETIGKCVLNLSAPASVDHRPLNLPEGVVLSSRATGPLSRTVDTTAARSEGESIILTLVTDGRFEQFTLPRHVAGGLVGKIARELAGAGGPSTL